MEQLEEPPEGLTFHYSREERLKHAPQMVQDFYNGNYKAPPKGIFRRLVYTRSSRLMLFTVIMLTLAGFFISLLTSVENTGRLENVPVTVTAFSFEDKVFVTLKCSARDGVSFPMTVVFTANTADGVPVDSDVQNVLYDGEEILVRTTFTDYDILTVQALCQTSRGKAVSLSAKVTH